MRDEYMFNIVWNCCGDPELSLSKRCLIGVWEIEIRYALYGKYSIRIVGGYYSYMDSIFIRPCIHTL